MLETRRAGALLILPDETTLGLGALGRRARKGNPARAHSRKGMVAPLAASGTQHLPSLKSGRGRPRRACLALASTRARHEAIARCVCTSCRVAEVERRRRAQRRASSNSLTGDLLHRRKSSNERGLAQSGRPRRAKWRRKANRGGKIARSSSRRTGISRKGGVAGLPASDRWKVPRVVKAVLSSRGGRGKRSRPSQSPSSRERGEPTGEATGASEVGRSKQISKSRPLWERKPPAGSASGAPKRVERRETHQAPAVRAQARGGR